MRLIISVFILLLLSQISNAQTGLKFFVLGISGDTLDEVNTFLQDKQKSLQNSAEENIKNFFQESPTEIKKILQPHGYFKPEIQSTLKKTRNTWQITYNIIPGDLLRVTAIDFQIIGPGSKNQNLVQILKKFPLKMGDPFLVAKYNAAKQFLFDTAANSGYFMGSLEKKEVRVDLNNYSAAITLHFNTGEKYYFGNINFSKTPLSEHFLMKFSPFKFGELYSAEKIQALQDSLVNSNLFQQVIVTPQEKYGINIVPIDVFLEPRKSKQYSFGIGYGTDTGIRGSIGLEKRYFTSTGQSIKAILQGSQVQNDLEVHYLIPGKHPATDQYDLSIAAETVNQKYGQSATGKIAAGYVTIIKGWQQTLKLSLQHERYKITNKPSHNTTFLLPSVTWSHNESDDPTKPTHGHSLNIIAQGSHKFLLANTSFLQTQIDGKYMQSLPWSSQLLLHGTFGYTAITDINDLPLSLSLQYFAGGAQSVRGYGYQSIGPGRNLFVGSIELRRKIIDDWYFATFYDIGNANNDLFAEPKKGAGIGIVWRTSIGAFELTYAKALNKPGIPGKIQFSMGPEL